MEDYALIIRPGTSADLEHVRDLVVELARYENAPDAVTSTIHDYKQDLEAGWFDLFVAESDQAIIGIALGHKAYSTWKGRMFYLDDLVVRESWRHKGIGKKLFQTVITHARQQGAKLLKWQVLEWNEPAIKFYQRWDVEMDPEWLNSKLYL